MTLEEYFAQLEAVLSNNPDYTPYIDIDYKIRIRSKDGKCFCPLTLAYYDRFNEVLEEEDWSRAATGLGMDEQEAVKVSIAADMQGGKFRDRLVGIMFTRI